MSTPLRIIFAGTPEFSIAPLNALLGSGHRVVAVYTQPDRPAGRGRKLSASPVKELALRYNIPIHQPKSLKSAEEQAQLVALQADLMVVVAYGLLLPQAVLDAPRLGCVNIHASLLPRWRGAAPIQRAILAGDSKTGITIMRMDAGLDTGPMLHTLSCPIEPADTGGGLHDRLAPLGAEALIQALPAIADGRVPGQVQDDSLASYARKLSRQEATMDWTRPAAELERQVRAFNPWPVAQTLYAGQVMRIWSARAMAGDGPSGTVLAADRDGIDVACADALLRINRLQMPGKRAMDVADFLNAHDPVGAILG